MNGREIQNFTALAMLGGALLLWLIPIPIPAASAWCLGWSVAWLGQMLAHKRAAKDAGRQYPHPGRE